MAIPDHEDKPAPSPLDAERARLRQDGYTDAEVSQILIAREVASQQATGAGQGVLSGLASNLAAASSYARNFLPGIVADIATLMNTKLPPGARGQAAAYLALKAVVILVLAYVVLLEFRQLSSTAELTAQQARSEKAKADSASHRLKFY